METQCPKCQGNQIIRSGAVNKRQRYKCKECGYHFSVNKKGKSIDAYYVIKAMQLHLEGVSLREIERILGISHVSVHNWIKQYGIKSPENYNYRPSYQVYSHEELIKYLSSKDQIKGMGMMITELGDKYMVIRWERFKKF